MRQLLDEADRVRDQHARLRLGLQRAHRGVERREELVGDQHLAAGERAHQRRLAGVGVADQRHAQLVAAGGAALVAVRAGSPPAPRVSSAMRSRILRRSSSSAGLARARRPAAAPPPPADSRRRGATYFSRAISTCSFASRLLRVAVEDVDDDAGAVEHLARRSPARGCAPGSARSRDRRPRTRAWAASAIRLRLPGTGPWPAPSKRSRALDFGGGAIEPTTPVPPVSAASSASCPLPSSDPAPVSSRFCDTVPTTS